MEPIWNINSCWVFMHFISIGSLSPSNRQGKSLDPRNIKYKTQMLNETPLADARNRTAWKSVHRFIRKQLLEILCRNGLALALICILEACFGKRFSDSDKSTPPSFSNSIWLRTRLWNCSKMERHFEFLLISPHCTCIELLLFRISHKTTLSLLNSWRAHLRQLLNTLD